MGNDNPFAILWTLMTARLFSRADGRTSLIGFNLSNSVNNETIRQAAEIRKSLGLEDVVRFEHHITETWKSIVRQPYNRRAELVEIAKKVPNISAKHEGGEPEIEQKLAPSVRHPGLLPGQVRRRGQWAHAGPGAELYGEAPIGEPDRRGASQGRHRCGLRLGRFTTESPVHGDSIPHREQKT